jgi:hypothetical protein
MREATLELRPEEGDITFKFFPEGGGCLNIIVLHDPSDIYSKRILRFSPAETAMIRALLNNEDPQTPWYQRKVEFSLE